MDMYKSIEIKESYFHSGFLLGFLTLFFCINVGAYIYGSRSFYSDLAWVVGYIVVDQILYHKWVKNAKT